MKNKFHNGHNYTPVKTFIYTVFSLWLISFVILILLPIEEHNAHQNTTLIFLLPEGKRLLDKDATLILLTLCSSIISYIVLAVYLWKFFIFRSTFVFPKAIPEISLTLSGIVTAISTWAAYKGFGAKEIIPGIFYALFALWFVWYTFFNTEVLINLEKQEIIGFDKLLTELKDLSSWSDRQNHSLYIFDYTPFIGSITLANSDLYKEFKTDLKNLTSKPLIEVKIICYYPEDIKKFYAKRQKSETEAQIIIDDLNEYENHPKTAIWRTRHLSSAHFIIADKTAYSYIVKSSDGKNELQGNRTQDESRIDFLIKAFQDLESDIVTPQALVDEDYKNADSLTFKFEEPQFNIRKVLVFKNNRNDILIELDLVNTSKGLESFTLTNPQIASLLSNEFYIKLQKKEGPYSEMSKPIIIKIDEFEKRKK